MSGGDRPLFETGEKLETSGTPSAEVRRQRPGPQSARARPWRENFEIGRPLSACTH